MFKVVNLRNIEAIVVTLIISCGITLGLYKVTMTNTQPKFNYTIVVDAGHGGVDGGAVGNVTKVTESYLNLKYAEELKKICQEFGFKVVMTRSDMGGLYSPTATNKKKSEMENRKKTIEESDGDVVISIHMNSFPSKSSRGAQVYYRENLEQGKILADKVQLQLYKSIQNSKKTSKVGDFFVLNCTEKPAILVECGFLSNEEEEILLCNDDYRKDFCNSLFLGVLSFFEM